MVAAQVFPASPGDVTKDAGTSDVCAEGPGDVTGPLQRLMTHTLIRLVSQLISSLSPIPQRREKMGNDFTFVSKCVPISFCRLKKITVDRQIALHYLLK